MLKKHELADPASCLSKAHPDEPVFVLRANDPLAAQTIRLWAAMAADVHGAEKAERALNTAEMCDGWRSQQPQPVPVPESNYARITVGNPITKR